VTHTPSLRAFAPTLSSPHPLSRPQVFGARMPQFVASEEYGPAALHAALTSLLALTRLCSAAAGHDVIGETSQVRSPFSSFKIGWIPPSTPVTLLADRSVEVKHRRRAPPKSGACFRSHHSSCINRHRCAPDLPHTHTLVRPEDNPSPSLAHPSVLLVQSAQRSPNIPSPNPPAVPLPPVKIILRMCPPNPPLTTLSPPHPASITCAGPLPA
jgi:hypothetical protein